MAEPKPTDLLLTWLSARGAVGASTWRAGCGNLAPSPPATCRDPKEFTLRWYHRFHEALLRAGHLEWDADGRRVRPVPPTLVQTGPESGFLCGARLPSLVPHLRKRGVLVEVSSGPSGPAVWKVTGDLEALVQGVDRLQVMPERGEAVLRTLPSASEVLRALPPGRATSSGAWERLSVLPGKVRWEEARGGARAGLLRRAQRRPPEVWLFEGSEERPLASLDHRRLAHWREVGRAEGFRFTWRRADEVLEIPRCGARLPLLVERFLRSATGEEPLYLPQKGVHRYRGIGLPRARHAARILEWTLHIDE